jgi:hypothetical protein
MVFRAVFEGGPRYGPQPRTFMAASVPERVWFAPERRLVDRETVTHDGWMLVGTAPGGDPPAEPWPGQVEFVLDPERSNVNVEAPGQGSDTAVYVFNDPVEMRGVSPST